MIVKAFAELYILYCFQRCDRRCLELKVCAETRPQREVLNGGNMNERGRRLSGVLAGSYSITVYPNSVYFGGWTLQGPGGKEFEGNLSYIDNLS
jgi:hypothetical protein